MASRRLLSLALATALTGCVSYQSRDLDANAAQVQFESRTLRDTGLERFLNAHGMSPAGEWDLSRLTLAAFYFSPELDVARAQVAEAEANVRSASARPNPTLAFTPGYNVDAAGGVTPWILGYLLELPLELGGTRAYRTAEARHKAEIGRLELAQSAWTRRKAVREALIDLHAADATAEFWRNHQPLLARSAQLVQLQVQAGEMSPLQAAQARIELNRAELAARDSDRAAVTARSRLAEAIGVPLAALADVGCSYRELAEAPGAIAPAEGRRLAVRNRADLLAALASYAATQSALQGEIARQYPDLTFGPGYELDQGEGKWSLGLGVTLPVLHRNQGPIAAAEARRDAAAAQFLAVQNRVLAEVDRALSDYDFARRDLETVKAMRANLDQQEKSLRAQQAAGETSRLELTRAQIELADSARAEVEARIRTEKALGALEDALQQPLAFPESAWRVATRPAGN